MRYFLFVLCVCFFTSCEENKPLASVNTIDVVAESQSDPEESDTLITDPSEGYLLHRDSKTIDYSQPNPYQHKKQFMPDSTIAVSWDDAGFKDARDFLIFFKTFQWDVKEGNKDKIASMIHFPMRNFKSKKEFLRDYEAIFTADFLEEVLHQNPMEIYRDKKGAMIGKDGQIWFRVENGSYRIFEINP